VTKKYEGEKLKQQQVTKRWKVEEQRTKNQQKEGTRAMVTTMTIIRMPMTTEVRDAATKYKKIPGTMTTMTKMTKMTNPLVFVEWKTILWATMMTTRSGSPSQGVQRVL
jgi:hypothetical protein